MPQGSHSWTGGQLLSDPTVCSPYAYTSWVSVCPYQMCQKPGSTLLGFCLNETSAECTLQTGVWVTPGESWCWGCSRTPLPFPAALCESSLGGKTHGEPIVWFFLFAVLLASPHRKDTQELSRGAAGVGGEDGIANWPGGSSRSSEVPVVCHGRK